MLTQVQQSPSNQINSTSPYSNRLILPQQLSHSPVDALCHYGAFKHLIFSIWFDTVPLSDEGANFPLWQSPEREPQFCFPLQNGNGWTLINAHNRRGGWTLINAHNRRSLFSISWPINPDPIKPKRIICSNNCRLAYRTVIIARWYIYISVMQTSH